MKRWKFIGLVSLMVFSLLGIIWVQLIWINNALGVRNDLFNGLVYQSLQGVARRIETERQLAFYEHLMNTDSTMMMQSVTKGNSPGNGSTPPVIDDRSNSSGYGTSESFSFHIAGNGQEIIVSGGYNSYNIQDTSVEAPFDFFQDGQQIISDKGSRDVVMSPGDFRNWVIRQSEELRKMGDQMLSEIYQWETTNKIDRKKVYLALQDELHNQGIFTPFEFMILDNNNPVDGVYNLASESDFQTSNYTVGLFSDNLFMKGTRLSVVFPERKNYILGSMSAILGASMLFSLIILLTFALSIFFIIRQKKVSEMKSDFINNMTHEFKTPIATISLAADTISNPRVISDNERVMHFIGMIKKENTRMNKQVENILQIASLDRKEMDFDFVKLDMHQVIRHSIDTIGIQVEGRNGNIFFHPGATEHIVNGDREHLTNLVHNLLDNANKYSPESPEITVTTGTVGNDLLLTVEDKGIGMTKSIQSKIFQRFYRQSSGNVHNVKGFGLGLSYVKAIVDAHHGHIEVFSEPGKGTKFHIYLPLYR